MRFSLDVLVVLTFGLVLYCFYLIGINENSNRNETSDLRSRYFELEQKNKELETELNDLLKKYQYISNRLEFLEQGVSAKDELNQTFNIEPSGGEMVLNDSDYSSSDSTDLLVKPMPDDLCSKFKRSGFLLVGLGLAGIVSQKCGFQ